MGVTRLASIDSELACSAAEHLLYLGVALGINFFSQVMLKKSGFQVRA